MRPGFTLTFFFEFVAPMIPVIERISQLEQQNLNSLKTTFEENVSPITLKRARLSTIDYQLCAELDSFFKNIRSTVREWRDQCVPGSVSRSLNCDSTPLGLPQKLIMASTVQQFNTCVV